MALLKASQTNKTERDSKVPGSEGGAHAERRNNLKKNFGNYVSDVRTQLRSPKLSQGAAAKSAGISRETWNRIERGKQLPDPGTIPGIAETLKVDVVRLFERAGYQVPPDFLTENRKTLTDKLLALWDESESTVGFALGMIVLWQKEKQRDSKESVRYLIADNPFVQILIAIQANLSRTQQLRLARELIQNSPIAELRKERQDSGKLFDEIDRQLESRQEHVLLRPSRALAKSPCTLYEVKGPSGEYEYHMIFTELELLNFVMEQAKKYLAKHNQPAAE